MIFSGIGVFTAWDSHAALGLKADWVALQADPEAGRTANAKKLRADGYKRVFAWEARARRGWKAVSGLNCNGYIGQAESQAELEACLALPGIKARGPKALVGNPYAWTVAGQAAARAQGWKLIIECYWNAQPWLAPDRIDSRGYPVASVLYGCYDATGETPGGRRVPLADYLAAPPHWPSWSVYLAETLTFDDRMVMA